MLNKNTTRGCVLLTTCAAALIFTGCRSMPGARMFGMRGEPSAAALAGSGPTTTYPAPPSASATPEAIASIAGGTATPSTLPAKLQGSGSRTAQVAGFGVSPGYATPASKVSTTNMAAAQANGIYSGTKSKGFGAPTAPQTTPSEYKPSGYSFGSKTTTPKPASPPASYASDSPSAYVKASSYTPPANGFAPPATNSSYTTPPATGSSGYTLPTDSPAVAAITQPTPSKTASPTAVDATNSFAPPAAAAPDFSTASTASATAPAASTDDSSADSASGYSPGSTGAAVGYPSGNITPTTTGSFYR